MTKSLVLATLYTVVSLGLLIAILVYTISNAKRLDRIESERFATATPSSELVTVKLSSKEDLASAGLFKNTMQSSSGEITMISCVESALPTAYPKGYDTQDGVLYVSSTPATRSLGQGKCLQVAITRGFDTILWISGMKPGSEYKLSIGDKNFTYKADSDGRIFLAERPFPTGPFVNYPIRLEPVCSDTGGWADPTGSLAVFGVPQSTSLVKTTSKKLSSDCKLVEVFPSQEDQGKFPDILLASCAPCNPDPDPDHDEVKVWVTGARLASAALKELAANRKPLTLRDELHSELPLP